jgi:DNA-binding transcriptional LysR family regulator
MELRHLRYFVAVASELSFSRAAETLLIAQPALSTQIADLEREIGTSLLFRNKRVVRLTAAGAIFLEESRAILAAADSAKERALRASRGEVGELRIGFFAAPIMYILPDLIRGYRAAFPSVAIRMHELTPDRQLTAMVREEIDIGFTRPLPPGHSDLAVQTLFRERFYAVVAETHPLATRRRIKLSELAREAFVLLERRVAVGLYDHIISACRAAAFSPTVNHAPDLMATVLTLVAAEQGVSLVPEGVRNLRSQQVVFIPISPAMDPIPLVMCWRKGGTRPAADAFRNLVSERIAELRASVCE